MIPDTGNITAEALCEATQRARMYFRQAQFVYGRNAIQTNRAFDHFRRCLDDWYDAEGWE